MRKRSSYRPHPVRVDALQWVVGGLQPVHSTGGPILQLRIKNHDALTFISKGQGTVCDVDVMIAALNMTEALARLRIGDDWQEDIRAGQDAVLAMTLRGLARDNRFVFTGVELSAVNLAMTVHDLQLGACTVAELEKALELVKATIRHKRARVIA